MVEENKRKSILDHFYRWRLSSLVEKLRSMEEFRSDAKNLLLPLNLSMSYFDREFDQGGT